MVGREQAPPVGEQRSHADNVWINRVRGLTRPLFWLALIVIVTGELWPYLSIATPWDKVAHVVGYFGLAMLATLSAAKRSRALTFLVGLIVLGGCLEIAQGYTHRDPDIFDELANAVGAVSGWLFALLALRFLSNYVALRSPAMRAE